MTPIARIIQLRDPLICGDGRPFAAGLRGRTGGWPHPSLLAGTARTQLILPDEFDAQGRISHEINQRLLQVRLAGPVPAWRNGDQTWQPAFPAPADALPARPEKKSESVEYHPLRPCKTLPAGAGMDSISPELRLYPLLAQNPPAGKPPAQLPRFWKLSAFRQWLETSAGQSRAWAPSDCLMEPLAGSRTHVSVNFESQTAEEGLLFSTESLDFGPIIAAGDAEEQPGQSERPELALFCRLSLPPGLDAQRLRGAIPMGGEGRLTLWEDSPDLLSDFQPSKDLLAQIRSARRLRLSLLTPAWFQHGWLAEWMKAGQWSWPGGSRLPMRLIAAAVPRPVPISGWDLFLHQPKPTRWLAPAGAVYFFELPEGASEEQLRQLWLAAVSDEMPKERSFRQDGFGLAVFGAWDYTSAM